MYDILDLNNKLVDELKDIAQKLNITDYDSLLKQELIIKIVENQAADGVRNDTPLMSSEKKEPRNTDRPRAGRPRKVKDAAPVDKETLMNDERASLFSEPIIVQQQEEIIPQPITETPIISEQPENIEIPAAPVQTEAPVNSENQTNENKELPNE